MLTVKVSQHVGKIAKMVPRTAVAEEMTLENSVSGWGTFKDSLRAPVHNWFACPAGFSWKAVMHTALTDTISEWMLVYDLLQARHGNRSPDGETIRNQGHWCGISCLCLPSGKCQTALEFK